jgi:hypothetical protein
MKRARLAATFKETVGDLLSWKSLAPISQYSSLTPFLGK